MSRAGLEDGHGFERMSHTAGDSLKMLLEAAAS